QATGAVVLHRPGEDPLPRGRQRGGDRVALVGGELPPVPGERQFPGAVEDLAGLRREAPRRGTVAVTVHLRPRPGRRHAPRWAPCAARPLGTCGSPSRGPRAPPPT